MGFCAWNQAFILACMVHCQRAPSLPADRVFLFVCLVGFFFFFLPESIGSDEERVVDVLW